MLFPTQNAVKTYVDAQVASATIADADATTKGKIQLAGDLTGTAASPVVATGVITNAKLANDAVTTAKILDNTILVDDLANDAVETVKVKDGNITFEKIQNVTTDKVLGRVSANAGVVEEIATTGSGDVVRSNTPTLVTPNIGDATGTSLTVSGQLSSTVATGTAPLVVTSTTPVANLNIGGNAATATLATKATHIDGGAAGSIPYQTAAGTTSFLPTGNANQLLTSDGSGGYSWTSPSAVTGSFVPYTGATGAVNLGAYDLTVNGIKIGLGNNAISSNTGIGFGTLSSVTAPSSSDGKDLTALGYNALNRNTSGYGNTAVGHSALLFNTFGFYNTAIGRFALITNVTGQGNFAGGNEALTANNSGNMNTAVGTYSLRSNTSGASNTAVGYLSLGNILASSSTNTALGIRAGERFGSGVGTHLTTANNGVFIGANARANANSSSNEIVIGADAVGNGNNTVTIGNSNTTDNYFTGNINGATWNGTAISIANGGTGATTAGAALTSLGAQSSANLSTDISTDAASTTKYPAVKTIKDYVDGATSSINTLDNGKIYVGNASNEATEVTMGGDVTMDNTGTTAIGTGKVLTTMIADANVTTAKLADNAVETAKIKNAAVTNAKLDKANIPLSGFGAAAAAVDLGSNKLTNVTDPTSAQDAATKNYVDTATSAINTLADGTIYVGNASNEATEVTMSGDVTMDNTGITAIGTGKVLTTMIADANVTTAKLADNAVTSAKIKDGEIVNADISASAAIVDTKLATIATAGKVSNSATTATDANTASAIVARDSSGNFSAGTITADLSGNATTATTATNIAGGAAGSLPYQSAAGTTALLARGTNGQVLTLASGVPSWATPAGISALAAIGSTPNANGATISGSTLNLEPASTSFGGVVTTGTQSFAGAKTFSSNLTVAGLTIGKGSGTGGDNTAIGVSVLGSNTTGLSNTGVGSTSLTNNTTGNWNTAIGFGSLNNNSTGANNVAIGSTAMYNILGTNSGNVGIGSSTLRYVRGDNNTAVGNSAGALIGSSSTAVGVNNVFIGAYAGVYATSGNGTNNLRGRNSVLIGYDIRPNADDETNQIVIAGYTGSGNGQAGLGSNTTSIGNSATTDARIFGALSLPSTTASTSTTTGALKVAGGVGIAGALNVGTTATITGSAAISSTTASTSTTTGALTVAGGAGIAGDLNVGGNTKITGTIEIDGGSPGAGKVLVSDANGVASWANGLGSAVTTSTAAYAITLAESIVFYTGSAAGSFTIPAAAAGNAGKQIIIKNKTGFNITITPASGSIYIDNANASAASVSVGIEASNNWIKLVSDGSQWNVLRALF